MRRLAIAVITAASTAYADPLPVEVGGTLEGYYALQAQDASNRVINLRAFDNRSRMFALSNAVVDLRAVTATVTTHLVLQIGDTPSTYYASEPAWKYLQAANITAKAPRGYLIEAGLFPSPIGPEVLSVKDNWNWSRSNLFFGLPFYHAGVMVSHAVAGGWSVKLHAYNGWNDIVDNNAFPSVAVSASYTSGSTAAQLLYFGGIERADGAPEGRAWRNLFDATLQVPVSEVVTVLAHGDAGVEPNAFGTSAWAAAALYAKFQLMPELYAAVRGDVFYEKVAERNGLRATPIFWPVSWVGEGTATLAYQPTEHASLRLEYRHDQAAGRAYYGGTVRFDPTTGSAIPNRVMQDTVTLGATAWF